MSTATLESFERDLRLLIRSRHGIAVALTGEDVKALLKACNQPTGEAFLQKLRDNHLLRAIPAKIDMHPRYGIDNVVSMLVSLNGGRS